MLEESCPEYLPRDGAGRERRQVRHEYYSLAKGTNPVQPSGFLFQGQVEALGRDVANLISWGWVPRQEPSHCGWEKAESGRGIFVLESAGERRWWSMGHLRWEHSVDFRNPRILNKKAPSCEMDGLWHWSFVSSCLALECVAGWGWRYWWGHVAPPVVHKLAVFTAIGGGLLWPEHTV